jgi:hypothetical protein
LLSVPDIHHEYVAFIAPSPDTVVSDTQNDLWDVDDTGLETSLFAIKRNVLTITGDGEHAIFNQRLKFWKIEEENGKYFYPSFEACKYLAVALGYAQWEKNGKPTNLATLRLQDSFPKFDTNEDRLGDKNPPAQAELYGLQFSHGQPVPGHLRAVRGHGDPYYIDTRRTLHYKNVNVWGESIDGKGKLRQPSAPDEFRSEFTHEQIDRHADPIQKALYNVCYLSRASEHRSEP